MSVFLSRSLRAALVLLGAVLICSLFASFSSAEEDVLKLDILTNVVEGQGKVGLKIRANTELDRVAVSLHRADGRDFRLTRGPLKRGETVVFDFPQEAGTLAYQGKLSVKNGDEDGEMPLSFSLTVLPGLKLTLLPERFDREGHTLALSASRPLTRVEWSVLGTNGEEIGRGTTACAEKPAGTPITVEWTQGEGTPIRIDLKGYDKDNTYAALELSPWWVEVEHDEVHFPSGSSEIPPEEAPKLDVTYGKLMEVLARYGKLVKLNLYVAGYTDTVGTRESNHGLSLRRARAIGDYFRRKGFSFPIRVQGFGEDVLAVATPDESDNQTNRRALYILAGDMPPNLAQIPRQNWESIR